MGYMTKKSSKLIRGFFTLFVMCNVHNISYHNRWHKIVTKELLISTETGMITSMGLVILEENSGLVLRNCTY